MPPTAVSAASNAARSGRNSRRLLLSQDRHDSPAARPGRSRFGCHQGCFDRVFRQRRPLIDCDCRADDSRGPRGQHGAGDDRASRRRADRPRRQGRRGATIFRHKCWRGAERDGGLRRAASHDHGGHAHGNAHGMCTSWLFRRLSHPRQQRLALGPLQLQRLLQLRLILFRQLLPTPKSQLQRRHRRKRRKMCRRKLLSS